MIKGIDVSHWQGNVDWVRTKAAGAVFAFLKMTDGVAYFDDQFIRNYDGAGAVGVLRGAYHWLQPLQNPLQQARQFLDKWSRYPCELPPVLDCEDRGYDTAAKMRSNALIWLNAVEEGTGRTPILYTAPSFANTVLAGDVRFERYPLWIANYEVKAPQVPKPWRDWVFWQYSAKGDGKAYGAGSKSVDLNWFNGDEAMLLNLCDLSSLKPGTPVVEPPSDTELDRVRVLAARLNVRSAPYVAKETARMLATRGQVYDVERVQGDWVQVKCWMHKDYVEQV
jgi:lysozyme